MAKSSRSFFRVLVRSSPAILTPRRVFWLAILSIVASCIASSAQNVVLTGAISGLVTEQSGAVLPKAALVLRNLATGTEQTAATNHLGLYRFLAVMPGTYSVTATAAGFRVAEALVQVQVGNTTLQDIRMRAGS
jgi:hypothetical protein